MSEVLELPVLVLKDGTPPCADYDNDCHAVPFNRTCHSKGETIEQQHVCCWLYDTSRGYCVMLVNP